MITKGLSLETPTHIKLAKFLNFGHTINFTYAHNNIKPNVFGDAYRIGSYCTGKKSGR